MKRLALAIALACVLSGSALAGDQTNGGSAAPGDQGAGGLAAPGNQGNGGLAAPGDQNNGGCQENAGNQGSSGFVLLTILDLLF